MGVYITDIIHFYDKNKQLVRTIVGDPHKGLEGSGFEQKMIKLQPGECYFSICTINDEDELEWLNCPHCEALGYYRRFEEDDDDDELCC